MFSPSPDPLEGNPDAIRAGMGLFRARCADCHGMDAHGVRAPDITLVWASARGNETPWKADTGRPKAILSCAYSDA